MAVKSWLLLPNTPGADAMDLAERLRRAIVAECPIFKGEAVKISASFGVAELQEDDPLALLESTDKALYQAKQSGRNRICMASATPLVRRCS